MADAWLPGAVRLHTRHDGGHLKGGAPRAVWLTSETAPDRISARSAADDLEKRGRSVHLVWNPWDGGLVQMVPACRAARMLDDEVGREGRVCFQILVIGFAREPFTAGPLLGLDRITGWLDVWRVPRRWPAGQPLPSPEAYHAPRERRLWAHGGHYGASQVPGEADAAPGAIDVRRITDPGTPVGVPWQREMPGEETSVPDEMLSRRLQPDQVPTPEPASSHS